jgi:methionine synthase II (cobalamin-independent)
MQRSSERILTTHVGSLARPDDLLEMMREKEHGRPYDPDRFAERVREAVSGVVRGQAAAGLDVVTDGEQGKVSFLTYVKERLAGFDQVEGETLLPPSWQREIDDFPECYRGYMSKYTGAVAPMKVMVCTGPVAYSGSDALRTDIANLRAALAETDGAEAGGPVEAFLPSTSPSGFGRNEYYASEQDYLAAVAAAMREEYLAIVESGFLLQINAGAYSFEVANPRHQHEWRIWSDLRLPDGKILLPGLPGLLGHATNYVEHPELIADGICAYAGLVGRENVIASADCGFSSRATFSPEVHPTVVWAKFAALAEGAALATKRLWGGN